MITEISNASKRLTAEGITFKQMYQKSYKFYKLKKGDNKDLRMRMDVTRAKITARKKFRSTGGSACSTVSCSAWPAYCCAMW